MAREPRPKRERRLAASADPGRNLAAARFFYGHLTEEQTRGFNAREEPQRFYMSACINFASGAVEALSVKTGVADAGADQKWRSEQSPENLDLFDRLRDVRIEDFHFGVLDAATGGKWVDATRIRGITVSSLPGVLVEATNPNGEVIRGAALTNVPTLYIALGGQMEATMACQKFIDMIQSLLDHARI